MKPEEILNIFFTQVYEQDVHCSLLDDIDFAIPFDSIKNYVLQLIATPYSEFLKYIYNHPRFEEITSRDITQCSSLLACTDEMCIALMEDENRGKTFVEIGQSEIFKKYITSTKVGALRKYGENQVKTAHQFGLAFESYNRWYLSCLGYVYQSLTEQQKRDLLSRTLLRNTLYADIITNVQYKEVHIKQYMLNIASSTLGRRTKNVVSLLKFCLDSMDKEYISRYNIFYPQYKSSEDRIIEKLILGTKKVYDNLPLYEDYALGYIPLYSIKAACGYFDRHENPQQEGWLDVSNCGTKCRTEENFVVYARGNSMAPKIKDGDLCLFHWYHGGINNGDIVLTQCRDYDSDYESRYTIKIYNSHPLGDSGQHSITLEPINNRIYRPIELIENEEVEYRIIGVFQNVLDFEGTSLLEQEEKKKNVHNITITNSEHFGTETSKKNLFIEYQNLFSHLTRARKDGEKAPHKVILLLSILSLIKQGKITKNEIILSDNLTSEFALLWNTYVKEPSPFKMNITTPYWHLQNESFWHLHCFNNDSLNSLPSNGSLKQLKDKTYASLDDELFCLLTDGNYIRQFELNLIELL